MEKYNEIGILENLLVVENEMDGGKRGYSDVSREDGFFSKWEMMVVYSDGDLVIYWMRIGV